MKSGRGGGVVSQLAGSLYPLGWGGVCKTITGYSASCINRYITFLAVIRNWTSLLFTIRITNTIMYCISEAKDVCSEYDCKYIEVSAALNHRIDDLLVGIVTQIRLRETALTSPPSRRASENGSKSSAVPSSHGHHAEKSGARVLLRKLFFRNKETPRSCDNFLIL